MPLFGGGRMNIYLIGMPGVGKSKVSYELAKILGYEAKDLDQEITCKYNLSIEEIFNKYGEDGFRKMETETLIEISTHDNLVVATGGGVVTKKVNKAYMQKGIVYFLDAPLALIKEHLTNSNHVRPLLKNNTLDALFASRYPEYSLFADFKVRYNCYSDVALRIADHFKKGFKKNILVVEGPNLNLLGKRNPEHYGTLTLEEIHHEMAKEKTFNFEFFFSNSEGAILDKLDTYANYDGLIINPAAYTHTSLALHDCLEVIDIPKVEVHLSAVDKRESYRQVNFVRDVVDKTYQGRKLDSYLDAISYLKMCLNVL